MWGGGVVVCRSAAYLPFFLPHPHVCMGLCTPHLCDGVLGFQGLHGLKLRLCYSACLDACILQCAATALPPLPRLP